ncbi:hypothetical protein AMD27_08135 [Acinetobacter sp. TGL-Y2]|uniref:hypothetical protein n=1 Tax=Acinetobacter sp. TGL-Y2 TaxID=1407071 RepID=UPI0007A674FF|nr:hypothetical protein [Acinetobacter sp. TGL-Y2]AMW78846.1 hypothetical protein AMD27_08135 [Acinetobacter sp. TGL-Y2]
MHLILGFVVSTALVLLARVSYIYFFDNSCFSLECMTQMSQIQYIMYAGLILLGTYNAHLMAKHQKYTLLVLEFLGTFLFAFALNFTALNA